MDEVGRVAQACAILDANGLGDMIWGHVSCRDEGGRGAWMKASGWGLDETTPDRVVLVDQQGGLVSGQGRVPIEFPIHTEILAARPDVGCVVHCHPTYGIAFAATGQQLRAISHEGTLFVPPDIVRFDDTTDLIRTVELGRLLAERLGGRNAALMVGHGIVAVGEDVATAVVTAILLERSCKLQLLAMSGGPIRHWTNDDEALAKRARCWARSQIDGGFAYLARRLGSPS